MNDDGFEELNPRKLAGLYGNKIYVTKVGTKKFKSIDEATEWLENQMILATVNRLHQEQLALIDEAVLKSDMKESKEVLQHIMSLK
jgi:RNA binding exosome subunit